MTITYLNPIRDLQTYGIEFLTGEACTLGLRGLFDLTRQGKSLVESFLGVTCTAKPWNSGHQEPTHPNHHVASIMLPYDAVNSLLIHCLFAHDKCLTVLLYGRTIEGIRQQDIPEIAEIVGRHDDCPVLQDKPYWWQDASPIQRYCHLVSQLNSISWHRSYTPIGGQPSVGNNAVHAASGRVM